MYCVGETVIEIELCYDFCSLKYSIKINLNRSVFASFLKRLTEHTQI